MIFATQGTKQGAKPVVSAAAATIKRRQTLIAGGALVAVGIALIGAVAFMRAGQSQIGMNPDRPPGALGRRAHRLDEAARRRKGGN
jgi:hypothetical protein